LDSDTGKVGGRTRTELEEKGGGQCHRIGRGKKGQYKRKVERKDSRRGKERDARTELEEREDGQCHRKGRGRARTEIEEKGGWTVSQEREEEASSTRGKVG
jgi:hypothetical protein